MVLDWLGPEAWKSLEETIGYLNFSSGMPDLRFLSNLNRLFGRVEAHRTEDSASSSDQPVTEPTWRVLGHTARAALDQLRDSSDAFRQVGQAEAVLRLVFDEFLPAYRQHHRDLLFHQTDEALFQPFFIGRVCEAVLQEAAPWDESDRICHGALGRLNNFLGHRPVAVLRTERKIQPYAHERVRPIPCYVAGAGMAVGQYHDLLETMFQILQSTDPALLDRACFDPAMLDELALDPRAFDFDHPVYRRPNYHFGQWDPHHIDNRGRYRRFVLQQVTLDAILSRVEDRGQLPRDELLFEAAAVLVGTMLMGSGVSGSGPDSHDSTITLAILLPSIAAYRDEFYEQLLARLSGPHGKRLRREADELHQPFGGARQDLNQKLARHRAEQLQHVHLARLFAKMGYTEAAGRQANVVPVASARMRCEMDCRLTTAHLHINHGELESAARLVPEIEDLLHRAIECGALVDPWNILGFGGQFSLFPAVENSAFDHRIDELIELINDIFGLYARLEKEAAAAGQTPLQEKLSNNLAALARWWDQFASTEVMEVERVSGREAWESAGQVATALGAWHEAGAAGGDVAFWQRHVERFESPKAFALLAEALLARPDPLASMSLLMSWLSQADQIPLAEGDYSFHTLAIRWMEDLWQPNQAAGTPKANRLDKPWPMTKKFLDYLEANADEFWHVPQLELEEQSPRNGAAGDDQEEPDDPESLYSAAYEDVTYRDTTDDGFDGEMLEGGGPLTDFELAVEAERISDRLGLLTTVARLWKSAAAASTTARVGQKDRDKILAGWLSTALENCRQLGQLLASVQRYRIPSPHSALDAMIEYDQRRGIKEALLERVIATHVEMADAARFVAASRKHFPRAAGFDGWEGPVQKVLRGLLQGDVAAVHAAWGSLLETLVQQPLLYIPTSRGGNARRVVASRNVQRVLDRLLTYLPRLGLLSETFDLLETIQDMEQNHPAGPGAITEFDRLFEIGCKGIVQCLVTSSADWPVTPSRGQSRTERSAINLVECLEEATELLLQCWLEHSRNIRISVLESVSDETRWNGLKSFIERFGRDLFTQRFMAFGNLRAIMHQGVDVYLQSLEESPETEELARLLEDLDNAGARGAAADWMELAIEAVVENYAEYVDYNTTTTQSDHGELLHTLLDFLRLMASYDRIAWNLRPVVLAHEVMVRSGCDKAAGMWRRAVARRTVGVADGHLQRFDKMSRAYGMRLPSIADRVNERFVRPMAIDRLCALIRPAVEELREGRRRRSFKILDKEVAQFTEEPSGIGFDVPPWLEALEAEVRRVRSRTAEEDESLDLSEHVPQARISLEEAREQMEVWEEE